MPEKKVKLKKNEDCFFKSKEFEKFKQSYGKKVEEDTWGKGLPMIYMDKTGKIVRHWKNGKIEIITDESGKIIKKQII